MNHPYLRAYMAGITAPTVVLLVLFCLVQIFRSSAPQLEWAIVFPLVIVPNAFGFWNMLYARLQPRWHHPIGLHGAALPFVIAPIIYGFGASHGLVVAGDHALRYFGFITVPYGYLIFAPFIAITAYYLIWKYVVGFLNRVLDLPS